MIDSRIAEHLNHAGNALIQLLDPLLKFIDLLLGGFLPQQLELLIGGLFAEIELDFSLDGLHINLII